jgi:aminocyclitol acetyltransferase
MDGSVPMKRACDMITGRAGGRRICLYGASQMAEVLRHMLACYGIPVECFIDRDYVFFRNMSVHVHGADYLKPERDYPIIVPFGNGAIASITACLRGGGYQDGDWLVWPRDVDFDINFHGVTLGKRCQLTEALARYDTPRYIQSIGRYASINHTFRYSTDHDFGLSTSGQTPRSADPHQPIRQSQRLTIGNDVWIGANVFVNVSKCHSIGDGAVIGAGAVIIDDIPPYAVAAGVPAKVKKYRFTPEQIDVLLRVRWWDWTDRQIAENSDCFTDYNLFFERFGG